MFYKTAVLPNRMCDPKRIDATELERIVTYMSKQEHHNLCSFSDITAVNKEKGKRRASHRLCKEIKQV
jgi:hypothetical protein